jgi:hypothetical protein
MSSKFSPMTSLHNNRGDSSGKPQSRRQHHYFRMHYLLHA